MATILQLLRSHTVQDPRAQRAYAAAVQQIAGHVRGVFDAWIALREIEADNARLANAAAVNRWDLMRLATTAEQLDPPRPLSNLHRSVHNVVVGSARACQLLANGYRFHKSDAVCDGQALLLESVQELDSLVAQLQLRS